jgi:hypothetical protein
LDQKKESAAKKGSGKNEAEPEPSAPRKKNGNGAADLGVWFAEFWQAFPRKDAEEPARRTFAKLVGGGMAPETLIGGAKQYALVEQQRVAREGKPHFTLFASTWLRDRRWTDPLPNGLVIDNDTGNPVHIEPPPQQRPKRLGYAAIAMK